jgi:hypothetical protein
MGEAKPIVAGSDSPDRAGRGQGLTTRPLPCHIVRARANGPHALCGPIGQERRQTGPSNWCSRVGRMCAVGGGAWREAEPSAWPRATDIGLTP